MTGTVVFSLDFELGWGHADIRPEYVDRLREEADETFARVRALVDLFDEYKIPATWAVVGKLTEKGDDPWFHNPGLFEYLLDADVEHDIGLHSYGHPSFTDLSEAEAREDVEAGVNALQDWNISPRSFIYPRGRVSHPSVLSEYGIECYRSEHSSSKIASLKQLISPPVINSPEFPGPTGPIPVPETMFLASSRPLWHRHWRVKRALRRATAEGGFVHLWWHPHNVITQPNLLGLITDVFEQVRELNRSGDLECVPMATLVE